MLAEASPAELGFLAGARALYYDEIAALIRGAADRMGGGGADE